MSRHRIPKTVPLAIPRTIRLREGDGNLCVLLPGLLQKGATVFLPLLPAFDADEEVVAIDYGFGAFDADSSISMVREVILSAIPGRNVQIFVGASLGGMVAALAVARLLELLSVDEQKRLSITCCDTPYDLSTAKQVPIYLQGPAAMALDKWRVGKLTERFMNASLMKFFANNPAGLPKPDEITLPSPEEMVSIQRALGVAGPQPMSAEEWHRFVGKVCQDGLANQSFAMWMGHAAFISEAGMRQMDDALRQLGYSDVRLSYIVNTRGNVNVRQPQAVNAFSDRIPGLKVLELDGPHCGFMQNAPDWWEVLRATRC